MPHSPNVNPSTTAMTLQVCSYNSVTDTATVVFDLNDHTTTFLHNKSLSIKQPKEIETRSGNMQAQGEIVPALQYTNRHIQMKVMVRGASSAAVQASLAALVNAVKSPALPYCLALAWPGMTTYRYADVVRCVYSVPTDPQEIQGLICRNIALDFECRPGLRGDLVTLHNLVMNPGFEGPFGGGVATTPPTVFSDSFATTNAYTVVSGGAPSLNPANTYVDIIHADAPLRHYRLGETSGTSVYDIGGMVNNGTATNAPTQGVAGGISGDTDTCYTFAAASSQAVSLPNTGLPTGNAAISLECWFKFAANPAGSQSLIGYGKNPSTAHQDMYLYIDSSGRLNVDFQTGAAVTSAAVTTGAWHHAVATWDGTTLRLYLDGAAVGTPITPGAQSIPSTGAICNIAALATGGNNYSGQIDEVAIYGAALSAAQVTAHYNAGHTGATGTVASAMTIPAAGQVKFGASGWGAVQNWQTRFRFVTGLTNASFYLHYTDANNYIRAWISATSLNLEQKVAGTTTALHTAVTIALVHEAWYWLQVTQFPVDPGVGAFAQATLLSDNEGAVGTQMASLSGESPFPYAPVTGQPQLAATGAALVIGGAFTNTHAVSLFGPGAWSFASTGTGAAAASWDGVPLGGSASSANSANPYSGGPVTSFGCARVDAAPAGTLNAVWQSAVALVAANIQQSAMPIAAAGNTLGVSAWVKTSAGLPGTLTLSLQINEYNSSGAFLRTGAVSGGGASATGAQTAWTQLTGTYVTGASCAFAVLLLAAVDATSGSAGGTIWWDNALVYNQTTTGQTSMPYCETRFPNSPAQLLLSGLLGDIPAPAYVALGSYTLNFSQGSTSYLQFALGRRQRVGAAAQLVAPALGFGGSDLVVLDVNSYGGQYTQYASVSVGASSSILGAAPVAPDPQTAAMQGVYHVWSRASTANATFGSVAVTTLGATESQQYGSYADLLVGTQNYLFSAQNTWTLLDAGQANVPVFPRGGLTDLSVSYTTLVPNYYDHAASPAALSHNWSMLLPVDASLVLGRVIPDLLVTMGNWTWVYLDGSSISQGGSASATTSQESTPLPAPNDANSGPGAFSSSSNVININMSSDMFPTLDPTLSTTTATGVNQFAALLSDQVATVYPLVTEIKYSPLYLTLR